MIKEFIGTGKTVEEATQQAKIGLNAPMTADVKIEVIAMPKKKVLGLFGGGDAKIKASYDDGVVEKKAPKKKAQKPAPKKDADTKKSQQPAPKKAEKPVKSEKSEKTVAPKQTVENKRDVPESVDLELAKSYLLTIINGMKIDDAKVEANYTDGVITLELSCEDYGIVIGRRGETLDSIQYLLSLVMKKASNGYVRVVVNVGNYREKRQATLQNLAKKNASYVLRTGRRYTFEPMNPYERRIIHTTVQEIEGVESRSVGYNQDRKVVIEPVGGAKRTSGGYNNNRSHSSAKAPTTPNATPKADRSDLPKFGKIEVNK